MSKVRDFTPADAASLAKCINESEGGWPGGITGGVAYTTQHMMEDYKREVILAWLVAVTKEDQVAGISTLIPHFDDPEAAYLGFLNVGDSYRNKGFGKALLVESVNRVTAEGLKRLFLHTWGGNLNAVPVYKRTGFFWRPETQVLMENYIPTILKLTIAQDFFNQHDWYETYSRKIELKPDEMKHRGLNVYELRWETENEFLRILIDRESRGPTLIENNELLVECWIADAEPALGLPIPVAWMIHNKNPTSPLKCKLTVKLPKGFELVEVPSTSIIVPPNKSVTLNGVIQGQVTIVPPPEDHPALSVVSKLSLGKTPVQLETGIRAKHPIQVSTIPPSLWCRPGKQLMIAIALKSNLKQATKGRLFIRPPHGLQVEQKEFDIQLKSERHSGVQFTGVVDSSLGTVALPIKVHAELDIQGDTLKTRTETIFLHCLDDGGVLVTPFQDNQRLQVHTELLHFSIDLSKGAHIDHLANRLTGRVQIRSISRDGLGPPFLPSEQMRTHFKHRIDESVDGTKRITTWMTCQRYSGLIFSKTFVLTPNSSTIGIEYGFENTDPKKTHEVRINMGSIPGLWDHLHVLPLKSGLLREEFIEDEFFSSDREIPKKREEWKETWYCAESPQRGEVAAILCPPSIVQKARGTTFIGFQLQVPPLPPKKKVKLPMVHLVAGLGTWQHIRRLWHYYYSDEPEKQLKTELEPHKVIELRTEQDPLLHEIKSEITVPVQLHHLVHRPFHGTLRFTAPKGWKITPQVTNFKDLTRDQPLTVPLTLTARAQTQIAPTILPLSAKVKSDIQTSEFTIPIIFDRAPGNVVISQGTEEDQEIFIIDNGKFLLKIAPDFAGSVFAWINKETGTNYLESNFPQAGPRVWFNPWYGGIRFEPFAGDQPGWFPTKLDREKWSVTKTQRNNWQGVKVSVVPDKEERKLRDLKLEFQVLTKPQSNIIALIGRILNQSKAPRQVHHRFRVAIPSKKTTPKLQTVIPRWTTTYRRRRVKTHAWPTTIKPYLGVEHGPDDGTFVFAKKQTPQTELYLGDLNPEFIFIQTEELLNLGPKETIEQTGFLVASQLPWKQAKAYGVLSKLQI
jgi:GNAT superfamily N-acetyltransferase